MKRQRGFTLIEVVVTVALLGLLASAAMPMLAQATQRRQERELRDALHAMRQAIDDYKKAVDQGQIEHQVDGSGYPPSLQVLVDGVVDKKRVDGRKLYFLRRIPQDPMSDCPTCEAGEQWQIRPYQPDGQDVFDVSSKSERTGFNGVPYKEW